MESRANVPVHHQDGGVSKTAPSPCLLGPHVAGVMVALQALSAIALAGMEKGWQVITHQFDPARLLF